jgi:hypothetical protein
MQLPNICNDQCDCGRYGDVQFHQNTAPNNTDSLERGHGIASYALRNRFGASDEAIEAITLCRSNHLIKKVVGLHGDPKTKQIFDCIFEYVVNGSIRAVLKKINKMHTNCKRNDLNMCLRKCRTKKTK